MKKFIAFSIALGFLASPALAGNVSQEIGVTGTAASSCVFEGTATPLTFTYTAAEGITNPQGGTTGVLHCNFGTIGFNGSPATTTITGDGDVFLPRVDSPSGALRVNLDVTSNDVDPGGPGSPYYGSDSRYYAVNVTAPAGQWTVPNANYAGIVTVSIDF